MNDLDISGVLRGTSGYNSNQISLGSHIIPTSNATYDLGNAEYKIRHLFLSDNSLWIGDDHKIDISGGKIKFKKRKKTAVPTAITSASGTDTAAIAHAGVSSLADMKLHHWEAYAHTLSGLENANIHDIFSPNTAGDWEEDLQMATIGTTTTTTGRGTTEYKVSHTLSYITQTLVEGEVWGSYVFTNLFQGVSNIAHSNNVYASNDDWTYDGSYAADIDGYKGIWVQQQYNIPVYFTKFKIYARDTLLNMSPRELKVFVSNNGTNWTEFHSYTKSSYTANEVVETNFASTNTTYTYIRFVFHKTVADAYLSFDELEIFGNIDETTTTSNGGAVMVTGNQIISGTKTFSDAIISASYTTTQRDALTAVAGMVIFNTTVNKHQGYNGSSWNDFY